MGIVKGGILGTVVQKVANVVFQKWKSLNTVREKVDPANPRTPKQVFQRDRFSFVTTFGRLINDNVILPFWHYLSTGFTTAWNEFFSTNIPLQPVFVDDVTLFLPDFSLVIAARGLLEPAAVSGSPDYATATGQVSIGWINTIIGNGLDSDIVRLLVVDEENGIAFINPIDDAVRVDGTLLMNIGAGRTAANLHAYLFLHRGEGSEIEVSNSEYSTLSAS
jgi:hypothetical protein